MLLVATKGGGSSRGTARGVRYGVAQLRRVAVEAGEADQCHGLTLVRGELGNLVRGWRACFR